MYSPHFFFLVSYSALVTKKTLGSLLGKLENTEKHNKYRTAAFLKCGAIVRFCFSYSLWISHFKWHGLI